MCFIDAPFLYNSVCLFLWYESFTSDYYLIASKLWSSDSDSLCYPLSGSENFTETSMVARTVIKYCIITTVCCNATP